MLADRQPVHCQPPPESDDEPSMFSDALRLLRRRCRPAAGECVSLICLLIDVAVISHVLLLDIRLTVADDSGGSSNSSSSSSSSSGGGGGDSNSSDGNLWQRIGSAMTDPNHPALDSRESVALFAAVTAFAFGFLLEGISRLCWCCCRRLRPELLDALDTALCAVSFVLNLSLLLARVNPLLRDLLAAIVLLRLLRLHALCDGLLSSERRHLLRILEECSNRENFTLEHQRMLQTELRNRSQECEDLRGLIQLATLSRKRPSQQGDSGHSSDSSGEIRVEPADSEQQPQESVATSRM